MTWWRIWSELYAHLPPRSIRTVRTPGEGDDSLDLTT